MSGRTVTYAVSVMWDGTNWTDESARFVDADGRYAFTPPLEHLMGGSGQVDAANLTLANPSGVHTAKVLDGSCLGRAVTIDVSINGGAAARVFTGVIAGAAWGPPTPTSAGTVRLRLTTVDGDVLQTKVSTPGDTFAYYVASGATDEAYIRHLLQMAGLYGVTRIFDAGLMTLSWLWADDEPALEEIWQVAAACGGRFYANEYGRFVFHNAAHLAAVTSPAETLTTADYGQAAIEVSQGTAYSSCTVEAATRAVGAIDDVWEPEDDTPLDVPASGSREIVARLRYPMAALVEIQWTAVGAGGNPATGVTLSAQTVHAQRVTMIFANAGSQPAFLRNVHIVGRPVVGGPSFEVKAEVDGGDAYWLTRTRRDRSVRANPYVQSRAQGRFLAEMLRDLGDRPLPKLTLSGLPGSPTRVVGSRIQVNDTSLFPAGARDFYIWEVGWRCGPMFTQDIGCYAADDLYPDAPYFVLNTDTLNGTKGVFY